jgi:hypothetical protein
MNIAEPVEPVEPPMVEPVVKAKKKKEAQDEA